MKWPKDLKSAKQLQEILRKKVKIIPLEKNPEYITGVDAAFLNNKVIGVACIFKYPDMLSIEEAYSIKEILFPYMPGFLSFREGQAIIGAIKRLRRKSNIILFDGQGIAHPKRLGIASHVGVMLNMTSIGCAKSKLVGIYKEPGLEKGNWSFLRHAGEILGVVLRTKDNVNPLFVSPGNRIDIRSSVRVVLACCRKYRIPEPIRRAHFLSQKIKRELLAR